MSAAEVFRILKRTWERFNEDGCYYRASAIAYALVLSAIPLMTILVKFAQVDQETIRAYLSRFMGAYGIQDSSEFLHALDEILSRADSIALVGVIFMIISATSILRHLEDSFNHIARSHVERPLHYRFAFYISGLILVPAFTTVTAGTMQYFLSQLKPPEWKSMTLNDDTLWMLGKKLAWKQAKGEGSFHLETKIDKHAPYKDMYFDLQTGRSGRSWEILGEVPPRSLEAKDIRLLSRIDSADGVLYILGETGAVYFSNDNGQTFDYRLFAFKGASGLRRPIFEDLLALPGKRALVLATVGSRSCLVDFKENAYGMQCFSTVYNNIVQIPNGKKSEIYITGTARVLRSDDGGVTWNGPFDERYGSRTLMINTMARDGKGQTYFGGGSLWIRDQKGQLFLPELRAEHDIIGMHIDKDGQGFVYGDDELFRYTNDAGRTWYAPSNRILKNTTFYSHQVLPNGDVVLAGENETYVLLGEPHVTMERDKSGHAFVEFQIKQEDHASLVVAFLLRATLWMILYGIVFGLLSLGYKYIPTHPISRESAAVGGLFTATTLIGFVIGFQVWVTGFANTGRLYGVWAVIPVGMILLIFCTQILFFGLELACVLDERRTQDAYPEAGGVRLSVPLKVEVPLVRAKKPRK